MSTLIRRGRRNAELVAVLDVGSAKTTCLIVVRNSEPRTAAPTQHGAAQSAAARVVGVGTQRSRGIKAGVVVDLAEAEIAIREAIGLAERGAGVQIEEVVLGIGCGRLRSRNFCAHASLVPEHLPAGPPRPVADPDVGRVMVAGRAFAERDGRRVVHLNRLAWRLDGQTAVRDPRGMRGSRLEADLHAVTVDETPLRNLLAAVERAYVTVGGVVASPFAAALAVTSPEERQLGVVVVDIGAGATTLAFFGEGHFLQADAIAVGGDHITFDIARELSMPLAEAERIKTLYGSLAGAPSDAHDMIAYASTNEENGGRSTSRERLRGIVAPRTQSTLRLLRERIDRSRFVRVATSCVVLTGGASQLRGLAAVAADALERPVRLGRPAPLSGLPPVFASPAQAVSVGLVQALSVVGAGVMATAGSAESAVGAGGGQGGYLEQVGHWLKTSF